MNKTKKIKNELDTKFSKLRIKRDKLVFSFKEKGDKLKLEIIRKDIKNK